MLYLPVCIPAKQEARFASIGDAISHSEGLRKKPLPPASANFVGQVITRVSWNLDAVSFQTESGQQLGFHIVDGSVRTIVHTELTTSRGNLLPDTNSYHFVYPDGQSYSYDPTGILAARVGRKITAIHFGTVWAYLYCGGVDILLFTTLHCVDRGGLIISVGETD